MQGCKVAEPWFPKTLQLWNSETLEPDLSSSHKHLLFSQEPTFKERRPPFWANECVVYQKSDVLRKGENEKI